MIRINYRALEGPSIIVKRKCVRKRLVRALLDNRDLRWQRLDLGYHTKKGKYFFFSISKKQWDLMTNGYME